MITAIYSLGNIYGAGLWLLYWLICLIVYIGVCFMIKPNRTQSGIKVSLIGLLIAELMIDLLWAAIYYPNGSYKNRGIVAAYALLLWIPVLIITGIFVTVKNKKAIADSNDNKDFQMLP